jgi:pyrroloquinoline quinone biosynthesis protein D
MPLPDRYPRRRHVPWRTLDTEALVVDVTAGTLYPLNSVAARIWALCDGERTIAQIVRSLADEFDADEELIRRDAERFIDDLTTARLVEIARGPVAAERGA